MKVEAPEETYQLALDLALQKIISEGGNDGRD